MLCTSVPRSQHEFARCESCLIAFESCLIACESCLIAFESFLIAFESCLIAFESCLIAFESCQYHVHRSDGGTTRSREEQCEAHLSPVQPAIDGQQREQPASEVLSMMD
jgi:hypothetical protein